MQSPRSSVNTSFSLILSDNKEFLRAYVVQLAPQPFAPGLQHSSKVALPVTCWRTAAWTKPSCCRNSAFRLSGQPACARVKRHGSGSNIEHFLLTEMLLSSHKKCRVG